LADGCPTPADIFSLYGEVKILVCIVRNTVLLCLGKNRDIFYTEAIFAVYTGRAGLRSRQATGQLPFTPTYKGR
jgi:hypothetical protein